MAGKPQKTVADLVAELQRVPQHLPVLVGCHYDNDNGLKDEVYVRVADVMHGEVEFYYETDPHEPGAFQAVTVS